MNKESGNFDAIEFIHIGAREHLVRNRITVGLSFVCFGLALLETSPRESLALLGTQFVLTGATLFDSYFTGKEKIEKARKNHD